MSNYNCALPKTWKLKTLGDTLSILTDYTANGSFESLKQNVTYYSEPNYAVLVRTTDLGKSIFSPERFTDEKGYNFQKKTSLNGGEIVLANVGSVGKVYLVPQYNMPMTLAPNTYLVKCNDSVDQRFVYQFLISDFYLKGLYRNINSTTLSAINKDNFRSIPIALPSTKKEQVAIRNILETIDQTIEKTEALIHKYQQVKAGLMHDLFSRGLTPDGKLRPPREQAPELYQETTIGWIPKEWKIRSAGNLCRSIVPGRDKPVLDGGDLPWITVTDIEALYVLESLEGMSLSSSSLEKAHGHMIPKGAVVMSCVGTFGLVAITGKELVINQQLHAFIVGDRVIPEWLVSNLERQERYMNKIATQTTILYLNKAACESVPIVVPTKKEQRRLIERIKAIADQISIEQQVVLKLKKQKSGLMHDLLTGKVQVKIDQEEAVHG